VNFQSSDVHSTMVLTWCSKQSLRINKYQAKHIRIKLERCILC